MQSCDYSLLKKQLAELCEGAQRPVTVLANCSSALFYGMPQISWAGFYIAEGSALYLGPFQGKPACTAIPFKQGVCGKSAGEGTTVIVPNVHEFSGHIACDSESNSEIVVPIKVNGRVAAVIDIDSRALDRFGKQEAELLEYTAELLKSYFNSSFSF